MNNDLKLDQAIKQWQQIVGYENVSIEDSLTESASKATFRSALRYRVVILPATSTEVGACLQVATENAIRLHCVSCGKNWGYGSRLPTATTDVLMQLSRMKMIEAYDPILGTVSVEPGVTFSMLSKFLIHANSDFFCGIPATSPDASVLGNALEKGIGTGTNAERCTFMCNVEVVLPRGSIVRTGLGGIPGAIASNATRWSLGPELDGLFLQSNLGVVTKMTVWLNRQANWFQTFRFHTDDAQLSTVIDRVRYLREIGVLRSNIVFSNAIRTLSGKCVGRQRDSNEKPLLKLIEEHGIPSWRAESALYSHSNEQSIFERSSVRQHLQGIVSHLEFLDDSQVAQIQIDSSGQNSDIAATCERHLNSRFRGVASPQSLRMLYWDVHRFDSEAVIDPDPDRDACGLLWVSLIIPLIGETICSVIELVSTIMDENGFEANLGFQVITDRIAYLTIAITYDVNIPVDDMRAKTAYEEVLEGVARSGIFPARTVLGSLSKLPKRSDSSEDLLAEIKNFCDPGNVLAMGRYTRGTA